MYKDHLYAAQCRRERLLRSDLSSQLPPQVVHVYARRQARIWASAAGVLGFGCLIIDLFVGARHVSELLAATWLMIALVYPVVFLAARSRLRREAMRMLAPGCDVFSDLARLDHGGPRQEAVSRAHRLELASLVLPMISVTLLSPLSLHLLVGATFFSLRLDDFSIWVLVSLVLVGHAHVTLLVFSVMHVLRVRRELDRGAPVGGMAQGFWALLWTVTASAIPGAILLFIPPVLVALTGLVFVPWMFFWASRRAQIERQVLDEHALDLSSAGS